MTVGVSVVIVWDGGRVALRDGSEDRQTLLMHLIIKHHVEARFLTSGLPLPLGSTPLRRLGHRAPDVP